jgi:hypothetical protein
VPGLGYLANKKAARIVELTTQHRLPAIFPYRYFVSLGGLLSYGVDVTPTASSRGPRWWILPVQQPTKFELVINLKTAKALGLDVPPTLLALADEVIE